MVFGFGCNLWGCVGALFCGVLGQTSRKMSNAIYYTVYLIWMVLCLVLEYLPSNDLVNGKLDDIFGTHGIELVYRASMVLAASFFLLFIFTLFWPIIHHMFLGIMLLIMCLFSWWFFWGIKGTSFVIFYRNTARIVSGFYLVLQLMAFVDFAFTLHDILIEKMEEVNKRYNYSDRQCCCTNQWSSMYITLSFFLCFASIFACIFFYFKFRVDGKLCMSNFWSITVTLVLGIFITVLCLTEKFNKGFLPPSVFFAIIVFYLLSSLLSNPNESCNPATGSSNYVTTVVSVILNITSGYWMAYRIRPDDVEDDSKKDTEKGCCSDLTIAEQESKQWCIFNFVMTMASMYLAMMCSGWYTGDVLERPTSLFSFTDQTTYWVINCSIYIGFLVFMWILLAPMISDRDF